MLTKKPDISSPASPENILITGASSGIGEALALHYAAKGVNLFLTGRNQARLDAVASLCRHKGAEVEIASIDVTNRQDIKNLILRIDADKPLDLVIANAGISGGTGGSAAEGEDQVRAIFAVNVEGVLNTVLPVLPLMVARGRGQIALMSSLAAFTGWPGAPAYSASKAAIRIYGEALRGSLVKTGIQVNVICPGFVESRMTAVNQFSMPFLMTSHRAAHIIASGLARNRGRIAFPWPTYLISGCIGLLPVSWSRWILTKMPQKSGMSVPQG